MDPLTALPPEVLLRVCRLLPLADRARLSELSRGWRDFADDEALWRGAVLDQQRDRQHDDDGDLDRSWWEDDDDDMHPDFLRVLIRAPYLDSLIFGLTLDYKAEEAIQRSKIRKVRKLRGLTEAVALPLLRRLAPHLEELQLDDAGEDVLDVIAGMGRLRVLHLSLDLLGDGAEDDKLQGEEDDFADLDYETTDDEEDGGSEMEEDWPEDCRSSSEDDDDDDCEYNEDDEDASLVDEDSSDDNAPSAANENGEDAAPTASGDEEDFAEALLANEDQEDSEDAAPTASGDGEDSADASSADEDEIDSEDAPSASEDDEDDFDPVQARKEFRKLMKRRAKDFDKEQEKQREQERKKGAECEQEDDGHDKEEHKALLPPGLQELRLDGATLDLLRAVETATSLRKLCLSWCFHGENGLRLIDHPELPGLPPQLEELEVDLIGVKQLLSLGSMPALRSLTLHGMLTSLDYLRPAPGQCRLRCLGAYCGTWRNPLVRWLMGAHAATLEELQLACGSLSDGDYFIPKLGPRLRQWVVPRLPALRRVLLRRDLVDPHNVDHDAASCRKQMQAVRSALKGTAVTVGCSKCG